MSTTEERKAALYERGVETASKFCQRNGFKLPTFHPMTSEDQQRFVRRLGTCGFYRHHQVTVAPALCAAPAGPARSRMWSYPRYKIDRTPLGVVAHELGHYVDHMMGYPSGGMGCKARPISGYEPNASERFAETMRLFILNPNLLEEGSPERYKFCRQTLGLRPVTTSTWADRLRSAGAPDRFIEAGQNWINQLKGKA